MCFHLPPRASVDPYFKIESESDRFLSSGSAGCRSAEGKRRQCISKSSLSSFLQFYRNTDTQLPLPRWQINTPIKKEMRLIISWVEVKMFLCGGCSRPRGSWELGEDQHLRATCRYLTHLHRLCAGVTAGSETKGLQHITDLILHHQTGSGHFDPSTRWTGPLQKYQWQGNKERREERRKWWKTAEINQVFMKKEIRDAGKTVYLTKHQIL